MRSEGASRKKQGVFVLAVILCAALVIPALVSWRRALEKTSAAKTVRLQAEQGDPKAQAQLAIRYRKGDGVNRDFAEAVTWCRKSAEQGYAKAQVNLGRFFHEGSGVPRDYGEALQWFHKAADQNDAKAQYLIGYMYYNGEGIAKNPVEAARWYSKAAEQGDTDAEDALGYLYYKGDGVPQDYPSAVQWYSKAAEQGDATAQSDLASMYYYGKGVERDRIEAIRWYRRAADGGNSEAKHFLSSIPSPSAKKYMKYWTTLLTFGASFLFLPFRSSPKNLRRPQKVLTTLFASTLWVIAGLSLYAARHDLRYVPDGNVIRLARWTFIGVLVVLAVAMHIKKAPAQSASQGEETLPRAEARG